MFKKRFHFPRLISVAIGLTVAALIATIVASSVPMPHSIYVVEDVGRWEFATGMVGGLSLAALFAWALVIVAAIIRWNSDFMGF